MKTEHSPSPSAESGPDLSFEKALARLEVILEAMTHPETPLEQAVLLFEEAEQLIHFCNERLERATRRIEVVMKARGGELALDPEGRPLTAEFLPPSSGSSTRSP